MSKSFLVCFTGLDGSGKSTHARAVRRFLEKEGYSCVYVWGASRPLLSYSFFGFTRLLGYWTETKSDAYTDPLEHAPRRLSEKLGKLLRLFLFIDFQIKVTVKVRFPLVIGKTVVCDRYFYDLLMDLKVTNKSSDEFSSAISKTLPRPIIAFLLDAPESLTNQRRGFSPEIVAAKRTTFLELAKAFDLYVIDSAKDFRSNQERIRSLVLERIKELDN